MLTGIVLYMFHFFLSINHVLLSSWHHLCPAVPLCLGPAHLHSPLCWRPGSPPARRPPQAGMSGRTA